MLPQLQNTQVVSFPAAILKTLFLSGAGKLQL
jgi:hypothetical protein